MSVNAIPENKILKKISNSTVPVTKLDFCVLFQDVLIIFFICIGMGEWTWKKHQKQALPFFWWNYSSLSVEFPCATAKPHDRYFLLTNFVQGAQWLTGRVLDSRPKGRGFEPHRSHCVVSLSKNINPSLVLVQPRKTCPCLTERLLMGRK